ncbi:hypothetical protein P0082_07695 [Candidatus Haliotispira prima]|uniref:Baseplate structural protein Gp10 C-terminal domain-containing protein n=1 Tax=Candidatus Haliotispira prima TaxID=3034016 RepID=A0ABY8MGR1_9SPIO|nr:hypothetical protein P0082_07695 [Candidatus Haliotispira prima]
MARNNDTLWLPENVSITDVASGTEVRWPGTDAAGDFQGRPDDSSRAPSYLDSGWLSRVNRTFGRLFNARGSGALNHNTTVAEVASTVSPHWMDGGRYRPAMEVIHRDTRYICLTAHTSTVENAPGQSGAPWESVDYRSFNKLYPVGSVYTNYSSALNPADESLLGFGVWTGLGDGQYLGQAGPGLGPPGSKVGESLPNIYGSVHYFSTNYRYPKGMDTGRLLHFATETRNVPSIRGNGAGYTDLIFNAATFNSVYGANGGKVRPLTTAVSIWRRLN